MEITTVVRKRDILISAIMAVLCLAISVTLYVIWPNSMRKQVVNMRRSLSEKQNKLTGCLEASSKLENLSRKIEEKRKEIESYESRFPEEKALAKLQGEIYDTATEGNVKIKQLRKEDPVVTKTGFVEALYTIELISPYPDLLTFMLYFESKRSPVYFTEVHIEPLGDEAANMAANLKMVAYGTRPKEDK